MSQNEIEICPCCGKDLDSVMYITCPHCGGLVQLISESAPNTDFNLTQPAASQVKS